MRTTIHASLRGLVSRIGAIVVVTTLVVAPPIVLWLLVGNPLPEDLPGSSDLRAALTDGRVAERTLFKVLALICWAAWFELAVALAIEIVGKLRGGDRPSVPVLGMFQSLAVVLFAGLSLSSSSDAAGAKEADLPPLPRIPETPASVEPDDDPGPGPDQTEGSTARTHARTGAGASTHTRDYVVEQRDSLWAIADRELGDPHRWPEILELNRDREQLDGARLQDPGDLIHPGWVLALPADPGSLVVRGGDTLWGIAETHLGRGARWPEIAAENADRIRDPDLLLPDWTLELPAPGPSSHLRREGAPVSEHRDPLAAARSADASAQAVDAEAGAALDRLREVAEDAPTEAPAGHHGSAPRNGTAGPPPDTHAPLAPLPPAEPVTPEPTREDEPAPEPAPEPEMIPPAEVNDPEPEANQPEGADPLPVVPPSSAGEGPTTHRTLRLPAPETWPERRQSTDGAPEGEELELEALETLASVDTASVDIESVELRPGSLTRSLTGAGIFAAGVVFTLRRVRRARERWHEAGDPVEVREHADTEVGIRQAADVGLMTFLDDALKRVAAGLHAASRTCPPVVGVNVADELSILFAAPDPNPVAGFSVEDDGFSWMISQGDPLPELPDGARVESPLPALFTLGHTDRSQVLLNPETANSIAVCGPLLDVQETLYTMAVDLATGPWAGRLRVVCVGFGHELSVLDNVDVVESVPAVRADLERRVAAASEQLDRRRVASDVDARIAASDASRACDPVIVMCAPSVDEDQIDEVIEIAHRTDRAGVTAIVATEHDAAWRIDILDGHVELAPMGVQLTRHRLGEQHRAALGTLLSRAARTRALAPPSPPRTPRVVHRGSGHDPDELPQIDGGPSVEIKILGPVTVDGNATEFTRRKALELIVYLALHRNGVETDVLMEALWPDRFVAPGTLHTIASLARRGVGLDASGLPHLPHVGADGIYRVSDALSLDYDRFRAYAGRAARRDQAGAIDDLRAALSLVRGRPFSSTGIEYLWTHAEALTSAIVAEITDAAHELACLYLDANDHRGVWWATQQGLLASPGNEQLHRDRMFAADRAGNPAGVEEVMEELCRAIAIDCEEVDRTHTHGAMHDELHPLTLEVYEQLTRRPRSRTLA